jgi:MYXO-CTERM domain-containing protein
MSLISLLSLTAYGQTVNVPANGSIQQAVSNACTSTQPVVIELQTDDRQEWFIGPGGINGPAIQYPDPSAGCGAAIPPITIRGSDGPAIIRYQVQAAPVEANMMTFTNGARVTLENVELVGRTSAEDLEQEDDLGSEFNPLCSAFGDRVRGVFHTASQAAAGSLTIIDSEFRCLDAPPNGITRGGAVYSVGVPVDISTSIFDSNFAQDGEGGAIALVPGNANLGPVTTPTLTVSNATFVSNNANFGGAISNTIGEYAVTIHDSLFDFNRGIFGAGGVLIDGVGDVDIQRTVFDRQNNGNFDETQEGGAIYAVDTSELIFRNNLVCGSFAGFGGGLFAENPGPVRVQGSVFAENGAFCHGGGLYIDEPGPQPPTNDVVVVNNTFVGNEGGRAPQNVQTTDDVCAEGGGGGAAFWGVNPEFRNNVVAFNSFGGGVLGHYVPFRPPPAYQIGDEVALYNNLFFENNQGDLTGDWNSIAIHPSNILAEDPQLVYAGLGELNCAPDAFYPQRTSPAVNRGGGPATGGVPGVCVDQVDTSSPPDFDHDSPLANDPSCDIGAFGGEFGLFAKDTDGDGVQNIFDCNDNNSTVSPNEVELCDFVDNDCDGEVDEGFQNAWYLDADGDGFGDIGSDQVLSCTPVPGRVPNRTDCDDSDATINPEALELCDGLDNDCDGAPDDGLDFIQYYRDSDNDTFGAASSEEFACAPPGDDFVTVAGDCNDADPQVSPNAVEICDGIDNDCDSFIDANDPDPVSGTIEYRIDADGDGFGQEGSEFKVCPGEVAPDGLIELGPNNSEADCNDEDPLINPAAGEVCATEDIDEDCDGDPIGLDVAIDAQTYYTDQDGDGFGDSLLGTRYCPATTPLPTGAVEIAGDCDDQDPLIGECTEGCGCSAAPTATSAFGILGGMLMLVGMRRRKMD